VRKKYSEKYKNILLKVSQLPRTCECHVPKGRRKGKQKGGGATPKPKCCPTTLVHGVDMEMTEGIR